MKKFIIDLLLIFSVVCSLFLATCFILDGAGWSDWAYKKLTTENNCKSMITGTSRAEQGIIPSVIDSFFSIRSRSFPMQNFAFTGESSPYGEIYFNAIKRKLNQSSKGGLFVVTVDPWSLTTNKTSDVVGDGYREDFQILNKIKLFYKPNISYFWYYCKPFLDNSHMRLHDDGWLEINVSMTDKDVQKRKESKKEDYKVLNYLKSDYRMKWLKLTIELFKEHGYVVMCRIPTDAFILDIENKIWHNFDLDMLDIAKKYSIPYFSFSNMAGHYRTTDGNHLYSKDAILFTRALCDSINKKVNFD